MPPFTGFLPVTGWWAIRTYGEIEQEKIALDPVVGFGVENNGEGEALVAREDGTIAAFSTNDDWISILHDSQMPPSLRGTLIFAGNAISNQEVATKVARQKRKDKRPPLP